MLFSWCKTFIFKVFDGTVNCHIIVTHLKSRTKWHILHNSHFAKNEQKYRELGEFWLWLPRASKRRATASDRASQSVLIRGLCIDDGKWTKYWPPTINTYSRFEVIRFTWAGIFLFNHRSYFSPFAYLVIGEMASGQQEHWTTLCLQMTCCQTYICQLFNRFS